MQGGDNSLIDNSCEDGTDLLEQIANRAKIRDETTPIYHDSSDSEIIEERFEKKSAQTFGGFEPTKQSSQIFGDLEPIKQTSGIRPLDAEKDTPIKNTSPKKPGFLFDVYGKDESKEKIDNISQPSIQIDNTEPDQIMINSVQSSNHSNHSEEILSPEELKRIEDAEKRELLKDFWRLEEVGISTAKKYTMDDPIEDIRFEHKLLTEEKERSSTVKMWKSTIITGLIGLEMFNNKFDPVGLKLSGLSRSVNSKMDEMDWAFRELHKKYCKKGKLSPELFILWTLASCTVTTHVNNTKKEADAKEAQKNNQPQPYQYPPYGMWGYPPYPPPPMPYPPYQHPHPMPPPPHDHLNKGYAPPKFPPKTPFTPQPPSNIPHTGQMKTTYQPPKTTYQPPKTAVPKLEEDPITPPSIPLPNPLNPFPGYNPGAGNFQNDAPIDPPSQPRKRRKIAPAPNAALPIIRTKKAPITSHYSDIGKEVQEEEKKKEEEERKKEDEKEEEEKSESFGFKMENGKIVFN